MMLTLTVQIRTTEHHSRRPLRIGIREVVRLLLSQGSVSPHNSGRYGHSLLSRAIENEHEKVVELLQPQIAASTCNA